MTYNKTKHRHEHADGVVHFFCYAPDAQSVFVAGTFNEWQPDATPMTRAAEGEWETSLPLSSGRYEYKFVVDGQWCCKPGCEHEYSGCPKCVPNEFGTMNRTLEVAKKAKLEEINQVLANLKAGKVEDRIVIDFAR